MLKQRTSAILLTVFIVMYGLVLSQTDQMQTSGKEPMEVAFSPLPIQKTVWGYAQQLGAEFSYISAAVYLGGNVKHSDTDLYANALATRCKDMVALHPYLLDPYYLCESNLAWIDSAYTLAASEMLMEGFQYRNDQWILPFFAGFNHFHFLQEPNAAAKIIRTASVVDGAPDWLGRLANTLAAKGGGELETGLRWLELMLADEDDEVARLRYQQDISSFKKALQIQEAIYTFEMKNGNKPNILDDLVPNYIVSLEMTDGNYEMRYDRPRLYLERRGAHE